MFQRESNSIRICAIHNTDLSSESPKLFSRAVEVAQTTLPPAVARQFLAKVLEKDNAKKIIAGTKKWKDFEIAVSDLQTFLYEHFDVFLSAYIHTYIHE